MGDTISSDFGFIMLCAFHLSLFKAASQREGKELEITLKSRCFFFSLRPGKISPYFESDSWLTYPVSCVSYSQWGFLVPLIGGRYHIITQLAIYKWYILPIGGLYGTYHLLREPETHIDILITFSKYKSYHIVLLCSFNHPGCLKILKFRWILSSFQCDAMSQWCWSRWRPPEGQIYFARDQFAHIIP